MSTFVHPWRVGGVKRPECGSGGTSSDRMPAFTKAGKPRKRNTYPALCAACGAPLAPGAGVIERSRGAWVAFCADPERWPWPRSADLGPRP